MAAPQVDFSRYETSGPIYNYLKLYQQNGSQSVTVSVAGGEEILFDIPADWIFNPHETWIRVLVTYPAHASSYYNIVNRSHITLFDSVTFQTSNGVRLAHIPYAYRYHYFMDTLINKEQRKIERGVWSTKLAPALDYQQFGSFPSTNSISTALATGNEMSGKYQNGVDLYGVDEPWTYYADPDANNASPVYWSIRLSDLFHGTILGQNKDLYFAAPTQIRLVWSALKYQGFASLDDPNTECIDGDTQAAWTTAPAVTLLTMWAAIEVNPDIVDSFRQQGMTPGAIQYQTDYVHAFLNTLSTSTSQNLNIRLFRNYGQRLKMLINLPFRTNTNPSGYYDLNNRVPESASNTDATYGSVSIATLQSSWNSVPLQHYILSCVATDDFMYRRDMLVRLGIPKTLHQYYQYWSWIESWCNTLDPNAIQGVELDPSIDNTYQLTTTSASIALDFLTFAVFQRTITCGGGMLSIDGIS